MDQLPGILALLIAAAGWFYLFHSAAARRLEGIEGPGQNRLRVRLRQLGGGAMVVLAGAFYALSVMLSQRRAVASMILLIGVLLLLLLIVVLALVDLKLTRDLRGKRYPGK
jgi:hypothetical protein